MRRAVCFCALAVFGVIAAILPATVGASTTSAFRADLHDNLACPPGIDLCGKGVVHGYGTATATFTFFPTERVITLDSDGSTLRIALVPTDLSPPLLHGTWAIEGGTGVFAGATGSGVIWATETGVPVPSDTAHYVGTITLA
jgi:hypothetical protein